MGSPLAVDQYSRFMAEMFDERAFIGVPTVFQSFFGNVSHGSKTIYSPDSKVVEIDILRGNERIAALINRGAQSRNLGTKQKNTKLEKWTNIARVYPLGEEEGDINADQLLNRVAGENPYEGKSRIDRLRMLAREHHLEHIRRYGRLFEYLASRSLLAGEQPAIIGTTNSDLIYDFRRNTENFITIGTPWNETGADILGDIDNACDVLRENGHVTPNFMLMPSDVSKVFITDTTVKSLADIKGYQLISVSANNPVPSQLSPIVAGGASALGRIFTPGGRELWLFVYNDIYTDSDGNTQKYLPDGTVLMGYFGARCDRYFGPPEILPVTSQKAAWYQELFGFNMMAPPMPPKINNSGIITPAMFYSDAYPSADGKKVTIRTQSAPIFSTTQTDAFVTLQSVVVATS